MSYTTKKTVKFVGGIDTVEEQISAWKRCNSGANIISTDILNKGGFFSFPEVQITYDLTNSMGYREIQRNAAKIKQNDIVDSLDSDMQDTIHGLKEKLTKQGINIYLEK